MDAWRSVPLTECVERVSTPAKIPRKQFEDSGRFPIVSQEKELINGYWSDELAVIHVDSPLVVFGDHTQVLKYIDFDFVVGADGVKLLQPKSFLNAKYFYYFLMANPIKELGYARHYRLLKELDIRFPHSLTEQKRIVAILDEVFAGIATAVANTEKNLANARELFDSYLNNVFTQESEGWTVAKVGGIVESSLIGLVRNKKEQDPGFPFQYLKMNNISNDNRLDDSKIVNVDANADEIEKFSLRNGDFLFNTRNSHELVGKSCLFKSDSTDVTLFNNNIMRIRFKSELDSAFVSYAFSSKSIIEQLERIKSGTTNVAAIYYKTLQNVFVVFPPPTEQKRIVSRLNALSSETQRLEAIYQHKLANLAELKQSILRKAFSGELTAQPERALQEAVA